MKLLCKLGIHKIKKVSDGKGCCVRCGADGCKYGMKPGAIPQNLGTFLGLEGKCRRCNTVIWRVIR
jgi:hypothetical protein